MIDAVSSNIFKRSCHKCICGLIYRLGQAGLAGFLLLTCGILAFHPETATAQDFNNPFGDIIADDSEQPWVINADALRYDDRLRQYVAEGNVVIEKAGKTLHADYVRFDHGAMTAFASGNVKMTAGDDMLTGSSIDLDLENQTGIMHDGYLSLRANNFQIKAEKIEKVGENTYKIGNASVTTCDGETPDWSIHGEYIKVTVEGYGVVKNATMRIKNKPFFYLPYMVFPAKTKRQTGLLIPVLGASSRWGYFINQPLFWAINDSSDATFYANYMSERGLKLGGEYRYYLSELTGGTWMLDYLNDRKIDDGTGDSSNKWGYPDDAYLRPNHDRYWFRGGHYHSAPLGFKGRLEFDVVSDQDYLNEFKDGYSGYDDTEEFFLDTWARQLDNYLDPVRLNHYNLRRPWAKYNLNLDFRWFDDVVKRSFDLPDDTLQQLPSIGFDGIKQRVLSSPVYFGLTSSYNYFYRQDGDRGQRFDLYPRFYLPFNLKNFITIEPSLGLRETLWSVNPETGTGPAGEGDTRFNREMYDARLDLTSEFFNVYNINSSKTDRVKHSVLPKVVYEYVPDVDQQDLPLFEGIDRVDPKNLVTYSITNFLISRSAEKKESGKDPGELSRYSYRQIGRFLLAQSYDINEARQDNVPAGEEKRPFSPIRAELDLWLTPYVTLDSDAEWDVYDHRLQSGNIGFVLNDRRDDRLYAEYRFTRDEIESIYTDLFVNLTRMIGAGFDYQYNIRSEERLKTGVRLLYRSQCWSISAGYLWEPSDRKIQFTVDLTGLGGITGKF